MKHSEIRELVEEKLLSSYESMYRIAYSYVKNADDAMDIVQDSAYKAMKYAGSVKEPRYIETWIFRIVMNSALDFLKKSSREVPTEIPEKLDHTGLTDTYRDYDTLQALDILNERERAVIVFRFFEERKVEEIARILDQNLSTTKSLLYRSLKKLKTELEKGGLQYERSR